MISERYRFIYLHAPKTGGNATQAALLPYSDDRKVVLPQQDGVERFGLQGRITPRKHATLADYAERLGEKLGAYHQVIAVRDPFDRMVSFFFSPHRWPEGRPVFSETAFLEAMADLPPIAEFIRVAGRVRRPDSILRFERLQADFERLFRRLGLPGTPPVLARLNRSVADDAIRRKVLDSDGLRRAVRDRFREDMDLIADLREPLG